MSILSSHRHTAAVLTHVTSNKVNAVLSNSPDWSWTQLPRTEIWLAERAAKDEQRDLIGWEGGQRWARRSDWLRRRLWIIQYMRDCAIVCISVYAWALVSLSLYVCTYICACVCVCMYVCMHVCMCYHVCVRVYATVSTCDCRTNCPIVTPYFCARKNLERPVRLLMHVWVGKAACPSIYLHHYNSDAHSPLLLSPRPTLTHAHSHILASSPLPLPLRIPYNGIPQ